MPGRLPFGLAWAALAVAVAVVGCSEVLHLPAPGLVDEAGLATAEASVDVDVRSGDDVQEDDAAPVPDASVDAPLDAASDVTLDRVTRDVLAEAAPDVALDQAADAPTAGVLCGFAGPYCDPASTAPVCCETATDGATPKLACVSSESACTGTGGYYIECANDNDCRNSNICCHYSSAMRCEPPTSSGNCPGGGSELTQACDPNNTGECPGGQMCTLRLMNQNLPSPYWGCQ